MICPIMSKPINLPEKDHYNSEVNRPELFEVECKREQCVMWQREVRDCHSDRIKYNEGCKLGRIE